MIICGIESTCDETSVGLVKNGRYVLSNVIASSSLMHEKYGGVVPEVAARDQVKVIIPVLSEALGSNLTKVDAFAVANGPGLVGSLLIGVESAKTLSIILDKPLIAVNHLIGHIYASWLATDKSGYSLKLLPKGFPSFPIVALVVSGGHTDLLLVKDHEDFKWLGGTLDDATGEAFDKVARILGLKYPGGPEIEKLASTYRGQFANSKLPSPMIDSDDFDFSFSGLKTAVFNLTSRSKKIQKAEIAFAFQDAVAKVLVKKSLMAAAMFNAKSIVVGGGVAANQYLKSVFTRESDKRGIKCYFPDAKFAVDNGAMIAAAAYFNRNFVNPLKLSANSSLHF